MPHFTLEYSANLDARVDMGKVVEVVRKAAVETGIFPLGGIRVRAIRCEHFAIADGQPDFGFLDMVLRLGEGAILRRASRPASIFSRPSPSISTRFSPAANSPCRSTRRSTTRKPAGSATTSTTP
jgi:5-carboxymethyl-2-hydroxymuconate isomerase